MVPPRTMGFKALKENSLQDQRYHQCSAKVTMSIMANPRIRKYEVFGNNSLSICHFEIVMILVLYLNRHIES